MSPTPRAKLGRFVNGPAFAYVIVIATLLVGVYEKSSHDSQQLRTSSLAGCERGKQDRVAHARVYTALATYYDGVTHAASVKRDVKTIARSVHTELQDAAAGMKARILLCAPLIDDGREIPDRRLLRQIDH
jgi:hypothetical protein